ncbi:MAG: sigma-54 dependent transcriptional regulator [Phycisphaerae bacterium]|jgi:DNA-binding NtrC family response regulator|nr:sigma-54 dependent transcriptional regulator [Phycisphaerae bacterium]
MASDKKSILVIDDEESICTAFSKFFGRRGWDVRVAASGADGMDAYRRQRPDVAFLDVRLPDSNGLDVLDELRSLDPDACIVMITAYGGMKTVMRSIEGKAFDYLTKPLDLDYAEELALRALQPRDAVDKSGAALWPPKGSEGPIIGSSSAMQGVYKRIAKIAQLDSAVLILGPTGTGKELIARAIHEHGARRSGPFIPVNCGSLPEHLVESELFGHVRGAFTGAESDRTGRFEAADGGTLFLDEVGELPSAAQVKLLRVLDSQIIERVGSVKPIGLDVRILAATNRNLTEDVRTGRFRSDLYYRLAVMHVELPPLTDRREDIVPLAKHFLALLTGAEKAPAALDPLVERALQEHTWPGNVRELKNAVEHAAAVAPGERISPEDLPASVRQTSLQADDGHAVERIARDLLAALPHGGGLYRRAIEPVERAVICEALKRCGGNQSEAADLLGLHRNTLRKKLRELDIDPENAR